MERADPIPEGLGAEKSTAAVRSKSESITAAPDQPGAAMAELYKKYITRKKEQQR